MGMSPSSWMPFSFAYAFTALHCLLKRNWRASYFSISTLDCLRASATAAGSMSRRSAGHSHQFLPWRSARAQRVAKSAAGSSQAATCSSATHAWYSALRGHPPSSSFSAALYSSGSFTAVTYCQSVVSGLVLQGSGRSEASSSPISTRDSREMSSVLPALASSPEYGDQYASRPGMGRPGGTSGSTCQICMRASSNQSMNLKASGPISPQP
mmetsp:Transcript_13974/g.29858  ORF Transcript_13974/g.29858 Transcript_13974/m.29858 type:complete len:211 (+) Transcript_13974:1138-1770(+)